MNVDHDASTDPTDPDPSKPGLAAATLSALRAGVRSESPRQPADGSGPDPASEVATEPAPANDADADDADANAAANDAEAAAADDADADDDTANDAADEADADADAGTDAAEHAGRVRPRRSVLTAVCASVAVAALVFASVAGVLWWRADHGSARKIGIAREQIDGDARIAVVTVNTSDYRHPSDALANWLDVSTGSLHSQFSQSRSTVVKLLAQAKMVTKATVLDAAVIALDLKKGTATVIASVNVTRTPATGSVSTVRNRFRVSMTRTGGEWKVSNVGVVPVSLS